jgi:hypothetical protein
MALLKICDKTSVRRWKQAKQRALPLSSGGAVGFMLLATCTPGFFEEFVDSVVPELQRRRRLRTEYRGTTYVNIYASVRASDAARNVLPNSDHFRKGLFA